MKITLNLFLFAQYFCIGFILLRRNRLFYEVIFQKLQVKSAILLFAYFYD